MSYSPRHLPVLSLTDVTANFEQLIPLLAKAQVPPAAESIATNAMAPVLLNSWKAARPVTYLRDAFGWVHCQGALEGGANGTLAFTFPAGFFPSQNLKLTGVGVPTGGGIEITVNGELVPFTAGSTFSLDNIYYRATP